MKTFIAIPCLDMVHTAFFSSYNRMARPGETTMATCQSSLVYDSRNRLAKAALESGADRVLWLDSDMMLPPDLMEKLGADLDEGRDFVSALFFRRNLPTWPVIYSEADYEAHDGRADIHAERIDVIPEDIFEIAACGFGAVMMHINVIRDVTKKYALPFSPMVGFGEDVAFCWRARQLGYKLWCDPAVRPGHVGVMTYDISMYKGGENNDQDRQ